MKKQSISIYAYGIFATILMLGVSSCKKDLSGSNGVNLTTAPLTTATSSTIAVATNGTATNGGTATDSVYVISPCERGQHRDSVAAADLSATIQSYLTTNYSGYSFVKAFAVKDTTGTIHSYVVIINYNGKPVALKFAADGTFIKVLEQREKGDLDGDGWHRGGRFECRDGQHRDTIALNLLPTTILTYFNINYAADTLVRAFKTSDSSYLVISKNNGVFANLFTSTGVFVKRVALPTPGTAKAVLAEASLPSTAINYLTTTYPNYVLDKAFSVTVSGTLKGYIAVINANNTRYCVAFDAGGNFVAAKTIW
ncbi:MAG: hypothetical protein KGO92_01990 [Bacteroidota bacterium]|nr:hypothetical protein [Bacteroidota bacterium]